MPILNFTQHDCTQDQLDAGILDCDPEYKQELVRLLTFEEIPTSSEVWNRAVRIVTLFELVAVSMGYTYGNEQTSLHPMIGGVPFLMSLLEDAFEDAGLTPYYAFSKRVSEDQVQPDGSIKKVSTFKHVGLYKVS